MAQEIYVVIEFDRETYEFSHIEAILQSKEEAENLVKRYNEKFLRYSYEWFEETYHAEEVDSVLAEKDAEIADLKQKLESVQASMDADLIDAGVEIRRLQRALWIARAERAIEKQTHFALCHNHSIDLYLCINGASIPTERNTTMRQPSEWSMIWKKVAIKCRAKAEEFK